jgi:hypothetical protein
MKERILERVKALLEEKGKEHLLEFAEEMAELAYDIVKIVVEETETKLDDAVLAAMDGVIKSYLEKIDGK